MKDINNRRYYQRRLFLIYLVPSITMLNLTKKALEEFDNQHDFERMCADILNSQGYQKVEPIAPSGGPDGGKDIIFYENETKGVAFVTLRKDTVSKFDEDLQKLKDKEVKKIIFFTNQSVSYKQKEDLARKVNQHEILLFEVYDIERLRSLLDASLNGIRKDYLHIDDSTSIEIRSRVKKILEFPTAVTIDQNKLNYFEHLFSDGRPQKIFYTLLEYKEEDVISVPQIGNALYEFQKEYYQFKNECNVVYSDIIESIRPLIVQKMRPAWEMYANYCIYRTNGSTQEDADHKIGLWNYGITATDAERVFSNLNTQGKLTSLRMLFRSYTTLVNKITQIQV